MADFEIIAEGKLGSTQSNIEITSIPGDYTHLEAVFALRSDATDSLSNGYIQLNSATANYGQVGGYAQAPSTYGAFSTITSAGTTYMKAGVYLASSGGPAGIFAVNHLMIPNYTSTTTGTKVMLTTHTIGWNDTDSYIEYVAGFHATTSAITAIKIAPLSNQIAASSSYWLAGWK